MARKQKDQREAGRERIAIAYKPLADIKPYAKNPRRNDEAVGPVAESIKRFGFKVPIIIDADGTIVAGHTRYKAALKLGLAEVPTVSAADLTPAQVKAFRLADNKVSEMAGWDFELLGDELGELKDMGLDFSMEGFGFANTEGAMPPEDFFEDSPDAGGKERKKIKVVCPDCGKEFEVEA